MKRYELSFESGFEDVIATREASDEARAVEGYACDAYDPAWSDSFELYAREAGSDEVHSYVVHARTTLMVDVWRAR